MSKIHSPGFLRLNYSSSSADANMLRQQSAVAKFTENFQIYSLFSTKFPLCVSWDSVSLSSYSRGTVIQRGSFVHKRPWLWKITTSFMKITLLKPHISSSWTLRIRFCWKQGPCVLSPHLLHQGYSRMGSLQGQCGREDYTHTDMWVMYQDGLIIITTI